jgi:hypothetical protein
MIPLQPCLHYDADISKCAIFTEEQTSRCDGSAERNCGKGCFINRSFRDPDEVQQRQELDYGDSCPECGEALSVSRDFVVFCPSCGWEQ